MAHIHTGLGEHDLTVSGFIIRQAPHGAQLLLHHHKKLDRILQPGGHVELTEHPFDAVLREIREETGYTPDQLRCFQPKLRNRVVDTIPYLADWQPVHVNTHDFGSDGHHFHTDLCYAFLVDSDASEEIAAGESPELHWYYLLEIVDNKDIPRNVRAVAAYVMTEVYREYYCLSVTQN